MDMQYKINMVFIGILSSLNFQVMAATDPTRPYDYAEKPEIIEVEIPEESTDWQLNGVRIYGDSRSAILNGTMIREGESIGNARVLEIKPTSVVLEQGDKHLVVRMLELKIKQPARNADKQNNGKIE